MSNSDQSEPALEEIPTLMGPTVLEFGTNWCGYCNAAQPLIKAALARFPNVRHIKIEDGKGKRLGRHFSVKLWPTLIFIHDGLEVSRDVRPAGIDAIIAKLGEISSR